MANEVQSEVKQVVQTDAPVAAPAAAPAPKKRASPRKRAPSASKTKVVMVKSKRKSAVARASARPGNGTIRINSFNINVTQPAEHRRLMMEPISVSNATKEYASKMNITVNVKGGGESAQAQAVRSAIAKCIAQFSGADLIEKEYMRFDRFILVDDSRRVEPKKFKGPKARARFQKSYR